MSKIKPPSLMTTIPKFRPGDLVKFKQGYRYKYPVAGTLGEVRDVEYVKRSVLRINFRRSTYYTGWVYPVYSLNIGIIRMAKETMLEHLPPFEEMEDEVVEEKEDELG